MSEQNKHPVSRYGIVYAALARYYALSLFRHQSSHMLAIVSSLRFSDSSL